MIRQGFAWWPFESSGGELAEIGARLGFAGVDFPPKDVWRRVLDAGLEIVTIDGHWPIEIGFNDPARHQELSDSVRRAIDDAVAIGAQFVAVASGDRLAQIPDGMGPCIDALAPLAEAALSAGRTLLIEPLNTRVDHPGHECDTMNWAREVVDTIESPGIAVLFDAYHSFLMGEEPATVVRDNAAIVRHVHVASDRQRGIPSSTDGIDWAALIESLNSVSYQGYLTHEFVAEGPPEISLGRAYGFLSKLLAQADSEA